ncbi:MAG TPA: SDR family NAD(P)-dependent oxidoreductase [bacterium]|nr:SDR family NAD(P)-dependent oxidoreductase [bacterium]
MTRFEKQVAIVTGGAQGIGLGIAERLGQEGATIALWDSNARQLSEAEKQLTAQGISAQGMTVDVTQQSAVDAAMKQVLERHGRIHVLVTAAGILGQANIKAHEVTAAEFDRVLGVNLRGMFFCIHAVLPAMLKANYGRIVNMASMSGKDGNAGMLPYSTSKAGVIGLTKVVGKDYAETGITCNAIAPALVRTAMMEALPEAQRRALAEKIPMKRAGTIAEIAALVAFIASAEASFTTGFIFDASGGRATY